MLVVSVLALTWLVFWQIHSTQMAGYALRFERDADMRAQLVVQRFGENLFLSKSLRQFFDEPDHRQPSDLAGLAAMLLADRPDLVCLRWVPYVTAGARARWERESGGPAGPGITQYGAGGRREPAGARAGYYPVELVEPRAGWEQDLGLDLGSDPARREALERARDSGEPALTGRLRYPGEPEGQFNVELVTPVYQKGARDGTVDERRAGLEGFAIAGFRVVSVLRTALTTTAPIGVTVDVHDLTAAPDQRLLHHWISRNPGRATWKTLVAVRPEPHLERLMCGGREVGVQLSANLAYLNREFPVGHWVVLPAGAVLAFLLRWYLRTIHSQRERMEQMVGERTSELSKANQALTRHRAHLEEAVAQRTAEVSLVNETLRGEITRRAEAEERIVQLSQLKQALIGAGELPAKLQQITDGAVRIFGADFARIWVTKEGDLCGAGCPHAAAADGPNACRNRMRCLHLMASSGRYTHLDGGHRRVPMGSYKIGRVASGEEGRFVTNDVVNDPQISDPEWARELGLAAFAGFRLVSEQGRPMGVLALFSRQPISPYEQTLMEDLAGSASQVLLEGQARDALRQSEERFRALVESTSDWIWEINEAGVYTYVSPRVRGLLGYQPEELLGRSPFDLMPMAERQRAAQAYAAFLPSKAPLSGVQNTLRHKEGGLVVLESNATPVFDALGRWRGYRGIDRDITERRAAEERLQKTLGELERSNKELEQFAYVSSHDLQEPLRTVSSYLQLLSRRYQGRLDAEADEFIGFTVEAAKRMQQLINDLLAYSRIGTRAKPFARADSGEVLARAMANLQAALESSGARVTRDPLPAVQGDEVQLLQLFQNLLANAVKFRGLETPAVHVSAVLRPAAQGPGREWLFCFKDNGIGIDPKFHERIFVIFQRLHSKAKYPGTGIGLAICRRIVEVHGGRLWVESAPGQGAAFQFTLPEHSIRETSTL